MKNFLMIIAVMLLNATAAFSQSNYIVNVQWTWNAATCDCESALAGDYFKVTVSIYDDANSEWVIQNRTVTTSDVITFNAYVDVPEVENYCKDAIETPSFTIYAWVWMIDDDTNPPTECCSNSNNLSEKSCHEFYNGIIPINVGTLN